MLSVSSINLPVPGTPVVPVSRPALVTDAARPVSPLAEIRPTSAVSKERAKVESRQKDAVPETGAQLQAEQVASAQEMLAQRLAARAKSEANNTPTPAKAEDQPPSRKNPIQEALETQIKDVLSTVWKASGRAVDFLLGRQESLMDQTLKEVELPREIEYLSAPPPLLGSSGGTPNVTASAAAAVQSYTAKGSSDGPAKSQGQLLDLVA